jgi:hypothetical protein
MAIFGKDSLPESYTAGVRGEGSSVAVIHPGVDYSDRLPLPNPQTLRVPNSRRSSQRSRLRSPV